MDLRKTLNVPDNSTLREFLLKTGKSVIDTALIPLKVKKDKHAVRGWILEKEDEKNKLVQKIVELKSGEDLKPDSILDAINSHDVLDARINDGKKLYKELFGEEYQD